MKKTIMLLLLLSLLISCSRKTTTVYMESPNTGSLDTLQVNQADVIKIDRK